MTTENPFGRSITAEDIIDSLGFFDTWEERYKYIIDLGKELPAMPDAEKQEDNLVKGCQSQVWITHTLDDQKYQFNVDSDAFIVKGLLGVVLAAYNNKSASEIKVFDVEQYFDAVGLIKHLSPTRGNGLKAMVNKIQALAG